MSAIMGLGPSKLVIAVIATCLALYLIFAMGSHQTGFTLPKMPGKFSTKTSDEVPKSMRDISNSTLGVSDNLCDQGLFLVF